MLLLVVAVVVAVVAVAVLDASASAPLPRLVVDPSTGMFVEEEGGRVRILHGVNAVYKIPPYHPKTTGFDTTTTLSALDAKNLSQVFGMTMVRLGLMWPGAAPQAPPAALDERYFDAIATVVENLAAEGIYVLLDAHQDLFSRQWCGEGAPDWAVCPDDPLPFALPAAGLMPPSNKSGDGGGPPLKQCLEHEFARYYFSDSVGKSFQALYDNRVCNGNPVGLQDAFAQFWEEAAGRFGGVNGVLGYELINEPWPGDVIGDPELIIPGVADRKNLAPMYEKLAGAIRKKDTKGLVFFEHSLVDILGESGLHGGPGGPSFNDRNVLSYHIYCAPENSTGDPGNVILCDASEAVPLAAQLVQARKWGTGSMMTEFGAMGSSAHTTENMHFLLDAADAALQSWSWWQYKVYHDLTTAGASESFYLPDGKLDQGKLFALIRPYAQAVQGVPTEARFDTSSKVFTLVFDVNTALRDPTRIFAPREYQYPRGYTVTASRGCTVAPHPGNFVDVHCASQAPAQATIVIRPAA